MELQVNVSFRNVNESKTHSELEKGCPGKNDFVKNLK